jgi:hypothetical protein
VVEGDRAHQARVRLDQRLHVLAVVEEAPVARTATREIGRGVCRGELGVGCPVPPRLRRHVRHLDRVGEVVVDELLGVGGSVEHRLDEPGAAVLGQVETEVRELVLALEVGRRHPHELALVRRSARVDRCGADAQRRGGAPPTAPARLDHQIAALDGEAGRQLVCAPVGGPGDHAVVGLVDDREIPVAARGREAGLTQPALGIVKLFRATPAPLRSPLVHDLSTALVTATGCDSSPAADAGPASIRTSTTTASPIPPTFMATSAPSSEPLCPGPQRSNAVLR